MAVSSLAPVRAPAPGLQCVDWRSLSSDEVLPLLAQERACWRRTLAWDIREAWRPVEVARAAGTLPGFVALDERGRIRGWTWYVDRDAVRQVGAIVAESSDATRMLVAALDRRDGPAPIARQLLSVRAAAPGLDRVLRQRGFHTMAYRYLVKSLVGAVSGSALAGAGATHAPTTGDAAVMDSTADGFESWRDGDLLACAELCERAYAGSRDVRAFAIDGTPVEWLLYMRNLVETVGCGRLIPDATWLRRGPDGRLAAVVVTTDIGVGTAHIAQIMVDPQARGSGLGRAALEAAIAAARGLLFERVTLLVADSNAEARRLYARAGFMPRADFLVARK